MDVVRGVAETLVDFLAFVEARFLHLLLTADFYHFAVVNDEAFAYDEFHVLLKNKQKVTVEAKITKETNDPATFMATVASITSIGENRISLLMKGVLKERRLHYAEMLLEDLINQGLSGQDLLQQFKLQLRNRPIKSTSKK